MGFQVIFFMENLLLWSYGQTGCEVDSLGCSLQSWCCLKGKEMSVRLRFYLFMLDRQEGSEKERERNISVWLPLVCPLLGTWPAVQACVLTRNRTGDPLVCSPVLNPLSHTSQGEENFLQFRSLCSRHSGEPAVGCQSLAVWACWPP